MTHFLNFFFSISFKMKLEKKRNLKTQNPIKVSEIATECVLPRKNQIKCLVLRYLKIEVFNTLYVDVVNTSAMD